MQLRRKIPKTCIHLLISAIGMYGVITTALAGTFSKDSGFSVIKLVVPYSPGSGPDIIARSLSQPLSKDSGLPVIVENIPGASGNIGADKVARSKEGALEILVAANSIGLSYLEPQKNAADLKKGLAPIFLVAQANLILVTTPSSQITSLPALITKAKHNPDSITFATPGIDTPQYFGMRELEHATDIHVLHIPYKSSAQAITELLGGQVSAMFLPLQTALPFIKDKLLIPLAISKEKRSSLIPYVPTFAELKLAKVDVDIWYGLFTNTQLPNSTINLLKEILVSSLSSDSFKNGLPEGLEPTFPSEKRLIEKINREVMRRRQLQLQNS